MKTVIVSAAKTGHVNQCLAVCERLGWRPDAIVRIPSSGRMTTGFRRHWLSALRVGSVWLERPRLRRPGDVRIVASGAAAEDIVAGYRALYGDALFAAFSGRPQAGQAIFDVALVPLHSLSETERRDGLVCPGARATLLRRGTPVRAATISSGESRTTFAMVGGLNKAFEIDAAAITDQVRRMLGRPDARQIVMTFSRRTPASVEASLRRALRAHGVLFIDRDDRPAFERALAEAEDYVVTPDSLSMICEACDTGRPVRVFDLPCFDPRSTTAACVRDLVEGGDIALAPDGALSPRPPGRFRAPVEIVEIYRAWEEGRRAVAGSAEQALQPARP